MKVLVTGATGFVGQHCVPQLLAAGHQVTALARNVERAQRFSWFEQVRFIAADLHAPTLPDLGAHDALLHLAWSGLPNYKALFHFEQNLFADYRFLKAQLAAGVRQILVTGTCFEYGMQSGCLSETLLTQPANPYALAKDCLRKFLQALQVQHPFTLQWARLFYMYGPGQNPGSLLAQLDRAIDAGETSFNMSGGAQLRDYLPVELVARHLVSLLEHPDCNGVVNVCSGQPISVRALVEQHLQKRGAQMHLNLGHYPYPDYEPMEFWGDRQKLSSILESEQ
ncbi:MAG: NAD(P)-dependent oxidoreductase [Burkholderiaceae bacterium]|nr:MAG: NAD(P)-dependent oxidoreductase [Burkholderiaceae bacterium]